MRSRLVDAYEVLNFDSADGALFKVFAALYAGSVVTAR